MKYRVIVLTLLALALAAPGAAKEESKIQTDLENLGVLSGARAKVRTHMDADRARLHLKARKLDPATEYLVKVDGIPQARFTSAANGHVNVKLDLLAPDAESPRVPFDPRGRWLSVHDGVQDVLGAWYATDGEPARAKGKEWTDLEALVGGSASARVDRRPNGKMRFRVHMKGAAPGTYDLLVDGVPMGQLETNGSGGANVTFDSKGNGKKKQLLDFDPRGAYLEVVLGMDVHFAGPMEAQVDGLNVCATEESSVPLSFAGGEAGSGSATLTTEEDCSLELRVEVAGVSPGDHEVSVDGSLLGTLVADGTGAGVLTLDTTPDDGTESALGMDPSGGTLEMVRTSDAVAVATAALP